MKKLLLLLMLLVSIAGLSQPITVNTNSYTVPQLVNSVLINSPCVSATNVTWRTGTNFGSSNGIGFFQNTNPQFPMQAGVILSTGNVQNAAGPNTTMLNDGSMGWTGDSDLEQTLQAAGISMSSVNATVLEFDFTPISSHFNFDFVFASEEYGNFQCQFSDAFAFLLTNENTGVTTNLAVVPSTTTPISVVTIRDFLYNSSCGSQNAQYFGSFNGGSAAASSATNFNGETVLLNASSILVPNTPYHIKLVIADRGDQESDSAIFISSDSFNIGQDVLGLDMTVQNNTALCFGSSYTLSTDLNPANYTFSWKKNGVTIAGATGPTLNVTQPGVYSVTYTNITNTCQPVTDEISIEYYPEFVTPNPQPLYRCDSGAASYTFDLSYNTPIVTAGITPAPIVSYHATLADANNDVNPLPLTYTSSGTQTIYVRIKQANGQCFTVKPVQLTLTPPATATQPQDLVLCERSLTIHNAIFSLQGQTASILNGQSPSIYSVSYYTSAANASTNTNPITNPLFLSTGQTIYVRVQNTTDPACFSTTSFNLVVNPLPPVDSFQDIIVCESYVLPPLANGNYFTGANGTGDPMSAGDMIGETQTIYIFNQPGGPSTCASSSHFKVTIIDPLTLSPNSGTYCTSYALPPLAYGEYRTASGGGGTVIAPGTVITTSQTVYVYYTTTEAPFCVIDTDFTVTILPAPEVGTFPDVFDCVSYTLPPLTVGNYYTGPDGTGTLLPAGTVLTATQTVYVHAENAGAVICKDNDDFNVYIGFTTPADVAQCDPYTLPPLQIGNYYTGPNGTGTLLSAGTVISTPTTIYIYIPNSNTPNCMGDAHFTITTSQPMIDSVSDVTACESYTLPALTNGTYYDGPHGSGGTLSAGDVITTSRTVYVYAEFSPTCFNEASFDITINPLPAIDSRSDIDICNSYTLTALGGGNYYTGPGGTGTMLPAGTVINTTQTIYIYATSGGTTPCVAENSFDINIFSIEADSPADVVACDSYTLPALTIGNYYQNPGGPDANTSMLHAGDVITNSTTLYIYTESGERINCTDENVFNITINHTPVVAPVADVHVCGSYTLPALAVGNYYTGPGATGTMKNAGDVLTTSQTLYVYAATGTVPNCYDEKSFIVDIFNVDEPSNITSCQNFVLPALSVGKYYTGPNGTGTMLPVGSVVSSSATIYVYGVSPSTPSCSDQASFTVTVVPTPVAHMVPMNLRTTCDEDGTNDGVTSFDLSPLSSVVLGSQIGSEYSVTYYESLDDANTNTNAVTSTSLPTVFVRVSNALAPSCFAVVPMTLKVNKLPEPEPVNGFVCIDNQTGTLLNPYTIASGLPSAGHTFQWHNEAGALVGTASTYTATAPGIYTLTATNNITGCSSAPIAVTVGLSQPAIVSYEVSEDFADSQSITINAIGAGGDFEYQLDGGAFQDSNVFNNVTSGVHIVVVRDKNGCPNTAAEALVINYPHYFTPNNDGYHDTWNIHDLHDQQDALITIFDRYGKLLKQIKPSGAGWDGTYNGQTMPSSDYWFVVNYSDKGAPKEFKAHFAMKR